MLGFKRQFFCSFVIFSFLFFSCSEIKDLKDLEIPESISVKTTNTPYNFPLGNGTCLIRDKLSASELRKTFNDNIKTSDDSENSNDSSKTEIKVYDYAPEGTDNEEQILQYLIKYPISDVPLTISDTDTNDIDFSTAIPIENLNEKISDALAIKDCTYPIAEPGIEVEIPDNGGVNFNISAPDFDSMQLSSGKFNITVKAPDEVSSDFSLRAKIVLLDSFGNQISESGETDLTHGADISLELGGCSLFPNMKLKLFGTISGGTSYPVAIRNYTFSMAAENLQISKITGLNMTAEDIGDLDNNPETPDGIVSFNTDFTFSGINGSLVSATIKSGSLNIYSTTPDGWSGINLEIKDISVYQSDSFSLDDDDFKDISSGGNYIFNKTADISGKTIAPTDSGNKITLAGLASVSFENATISFTTSSTGLDADAEIEVKGRCNLDEIDEIVVSIEALNKNGDSKLEDDVETGLNFSTLLEDNLKSASKLIKNISFSGIKGYVYAIKPEIEALDGLSYDSCEITAKYEVDENGKATSKEKKLIEDAPVSLKNVDFDLDTLADNETFTITDSSFLSEDAFSATTDGDSVCELFNEMPDNLVIHYNLSGFTGPSDNKITLKQKDIDALKNVKSVQIFILIQIPLEFTLSDKYDYPESSRAEDGFVTIDDMRSLIYEINDKDMSELTEDLFDRDDAEDWQDEDKRKYLDLIKSVSITYETANTTQFEISGKITDALSGLDKKITFENEKTVIELKNDEIQSIFDNYPFIPMIPVQIAADGILKKVPRNAQFKMNGYVTVVADGEVEIWSK